MPYTEYLLEGIKEDADVPFERKLKAGSWGAYDSPAHMGFEKLADEVALALGSYRRPDAPEHFDLLEAWALSEGITFLVYPDCPNPKFSGWMGWIVGSPVRTGCLPPNAVYISRPKHLDSSDNEFQVHMLDVPSPYAIVLPEEVRYSTLRQLSITRETRYVSNAWAVAYWNLKLRAAHDQQLDYEQVAAIRLHPSPQLFLPLDHSTYRRMVQDFQVVAAR